MESTDLIRNNNDLVESATDHNVPVGNEQMTVTQLQPIEEMLGSVTTYNNLENCQQVRTSARVFKKMKLDSALALITAPVPEKKDDVKTEVKKSFRPQWSQEDKNIFFEALNEYGKDFDAIQQHINNKCKRKGLPDSSIKTKDQVRHFYYRTWHKISKHLKFSEDIKKIAQELYALINYGELRKKVGSISEKTCVKLNELIYRGIVAIRVKGKTIRIKTPMCRALRKLNQLDEKHEELKLPTRVLVELRPKNMDTWLHVQFMAQNPRVRVSLPLQRRLSALLACINERWRTQLERTHEHIHANNLTDDTEPCSSTRAQLYVIPRSVSSVEIPTINLSEYLTSHRICLNAYEERIGVKIPGEQLWQDMCASFKGGGKGLAKKTGIKRQRNESTGDKCNMKQKENCDEMDVDNPTTVTDVVDTAINTILALQKTDVVSETTTEVTESIKSELVKCEVPETTSPELCKLDQIEKIKNGWTAETCGTLTIGEMYLMFGNDSKLELEYFWDKPDEIKSEQNPSETTDSETTAPQLECDKKPSTELSATLRKLLSLARLHYRKEIIRCPCGHVCGGASKAAANKNRVFAARTNQRPVVEKKIISDPSVITELNSLRSITVKPDFRKPAMYPTNGAGTDSFTAQLDSLQRMIPKCTNRKGRPVRSKHVVVERMLPLLPKPLLNGQPIVTMKVISQTDDNSNSKLRSIAPKVDETKQPDITPNCSEFETTNIVSSEAETAELTVQDNTDTIMGDHDISSSTSISNFLSLDIPQSDTNDLILSETVAEMKDNLTSFAGLLSDGISDNTNPLMSPSRILKENDTQWLSSEVNDYSLTSLLGHLESPMKSTTTNIISCDDTPISQDIDSQFRSLLGENGVDFVEQFVDMAAQVNPETNEISN